MSRPASVVLFSSASGDQVRDWAKRFERYRLTAGQSLQVICVSSLQNSPFSLLPDADDPAVLWDVDGRMPPKEIEKLIGGFAAGECRAAVRYAASSESRGVSRGKRIWRIFTGFVRQVLGRPSDPRPLAAAITSAELRRWSARLTSTPRKGWVSSALRFSARARIPLKEIPVMWSCAGNTRLPDTTNKGKQI